MTEMPFAVVLTGLACGVLLAAAGLAVWGGFRQEIGVWRALRPLRWLAGFLLLGGILAGRLQSGVSTLDTRPLVLAAAAALPLRDRLDRTPWSNVPALLPGLVLAGAGLLEVTVPTVARAAGLLCAGAGLGCLVAACGVVGAQALSEALADLLTPDRPAMWRAPYVVLTLLVGGSVLVNLWQRGSLQAGAQGEAVLAAAWLMWGAAWLVPQRYPRLKPALVSTAALALVSLTLG